MEAVKQLRGKGYEPSESELKWFNDRLAREFGLNPFGEPKFRVVNGRTARHFSMGDPQAIKYVNLVDPADEMGMPYPILEEWMPAERLGTPEDWESHRWFTGSGESGKLDVLGEYPRRGMYFLCGGRLLMNALCEPLPLTEEVLQQIVGMIKSKPPTEKQAQAVREMQDKAALAKAKKRALVKEQSKALWDSYQTKKEAIEAVASRDYSKNLGDSNYRLKGGLYVPSN